jgi:hypothetical protein
MSFQTWTLFRDARFRAVLCCGAVILFSAAGLKADNIAYAGSSSGAFGFIDLNTGAFTSLGNSGQTLAGLAVATGSIFATSYHTASGTLYEVNPANGDLTSIGTATGVDYDDFGSTTAGLYAVSSGSIQDLYSISPSTGGSDIDRADRARLWVVARSVDQFEHALFCRWSRPLHVKHEHGCGNAGGTLWRFRGNGSAAHGRRHPIRGRRYESHGGCHQHQHRSCHYRP